jgi:HEAT repeat protein
VTNNKRLLTKLAVCGIAALGGWSLAFARDPLPDPQAAAASKSAEDQKYEAGQALLNSSRWEEAASAFRAIAEMKGSRAAAALYWQAYAENKMEHASEALETCARLRSSYPQSEWLKECGALEIDICANAGLNPRCLAIMAGKLHAVPPPGRVAGGSGSTQAEQDEDLKLLALSALAQHDRAEAIPILKNILTGNHSPKMKERALFVLTQIDSKEAQDVLAQVARGQSGPELQLKAIQMLAAQEGKKASPLLDEIYRSSSDVRVKEAILHSYLVSGDSSKLLDAARGETNPQLVRAAVHTLGAMGEADQLLSLYRSAKTSEAKAAIIDGFVPCGERANAALKEIATAEPDSQLRRKAIRNLGITGGSASGPMLVEIFQKSSDEDSKKAALDGLFVAGDAHDLISLARAEKDYGMKKKIVEKLSIMGNKEATEYMMELLK